MNLTTSQILMLAGMALAFGGYFALTWHKHQKGRELIMARDKRLYPDNYDQLQKADRKRLYRIHTWQAAWDRAGKLYAAIGISGVAVFLYSIILRASSG
jgi:hypothetical protein